MCANQACLGYFLIVILASFGGLIYFGLRYRKKKLSANLEITADQIWKNASLKNVQSILEKSDLLFGIWQDISSTFQALVVKNDSNMVVSRVEFSMGTRQICFETEEKHYQIRFPLTWLQSARLSSVQSPELTLATYSVLNFFGKHQFEIPGYGTLTSEREWLCLRKTVYYHLENRLVGMTQEISPTMQVGRIAIFKSEIPIHIRYFIMAL